MPWYLRTAGKVRYQSKGEGEQGRELLCSTDNFLRASIRPPVSLRYALPIGYKVR